MIAATVVAIALAAGPGTIPETRKVAFAEAVQQAVARNTSAVVAAEEVRRTEALLGEVRSSSLPFLGVTGAVTWLDHARRTPAGIVAPGQQGNLTGTLSVPLVAPSRWAAWANASRAADASVASDADVRRSVAIAAARAYLSVVAQRRTVEVSQTAVGTSRAHYEYARARFLGGVGNALDQLRAEQELAASQVQLHAALTLLVRGRETLGQIMGEDQPIDAAEVPDLPVLPGETQALAEAEAARADVQAARARASVAEHVYGDSWTDWMPTLSGTFQGFLQDPPTTTFPQTGWQALIVLSFPVYEGGLRPAQAQERDALAKEAQAQVHGVVREARSQVRVAFEALEQARAAYEAARRGGQSAKAALDLATKAYRAGAVDNLAVTDAEQRARGADLSAVIAEDAVRQNLLDLLAAAGRFP